MKKYLFNKVYILLMLLVLIVGSISAKYMSSITDNILVTPSNFIFSSNYDDGNTYYLKTGTYNLEVYNHEMDIVTKEDIHYTLTVTDNNSLTNVLVKEDILEGSDTNASGVKDTYTFYVNSNVTYTVTITTSKPYTKTITYTIIGLDSSEVGNKYTIIDNGYWFQLDVYIGKNIPSTLTINYTGYTPDNTNQFMKNWKTMDNNGTINQNQLDDYAYYSFIFIGDFNGNVVQDEAFNNLIDLTQ